MKNNRKTIKLCALMLGVIVLLCAFPFSAGAIVYNEYFSLDELKESVTSKGTQEMPIVKEITFENDEVAMYDKFEVRFNIDATWTNPYDPDDIQVDGVFTYPSGKTVTIPAFFMTPMVPVNEDKLNLTYSSQSHNYDPEYNGKSCWALRFAGDEEGDYSFYITVTDAQGNSSKSTNYEFSCYDAGNKGWAQISEDNPEYIVNSYDGSVYYGSGVNLPWVRSQFTKDPTHLSYNYFVDKAKGNTNMTRIWLCCYNWLEWMPNASSFDTWSFVGHGYYSQTMATSFDDVLELCEDAGLRIILTLEDNDERITGSTEYGTWKWNPYSIENGGSALNPDEYWTSKEVREQYKKRLRYMIARWGYSSAIFSFNMWNDMGNGITDAIVDYHKDLRDYAHSITDGWRPFLYGSNFNGAVNNVLDYTVQSITQNDGTKPYLTQECYADGDDFRGTLRNTIWTEFTQGAAATMFWSQDVVDEYDNNKGCWDVFDKILDFTADIPLDKTGKFTSSSMKVAKATPTNANAECQTITEINAYGDVGGFGKMATENYFEVDTTVAGMNLFGYAENLYGFNWADRNPPTFKIDVPYGGKALIEVPSSSFGILRVTLDGQIVAEQPFVGPDGKSSRFDVSDDIDSDGNGKPDRFTFVDLTPGTHEIFLENISADWLNTHVYFIVNSKSPADMLTVNTMVSDSTAVAYISNSTYSITAAHLLGNEPTDFTDVSFTIDGLKEDGAYAMYQYNPDTGEYLAAEKVTVTGGKVDISVAKVERDYAIKLLKLKDGEAVGEGSTYEYLQLVSTTSPNTPSGDDANEGDDAADPNNKGNENGGFPWIVVVIAVVVLAAAGAVAFILISKKKKEAAPAEEKPEDKE